MNRWRVWLIVIACLGYGLALLVFQMASRNRAAARAEQAAWAAAASTSALRRRASGPPACFQWPMSPLVTETNFT